MNTKANPSAAAGIVGESLGLNMDDLGATPGDDVLGNDSDILDDEDDSGDEGGVRPSPDDDGGDDGDDDQGDVSHSRSQQQQRNPNESRGQRRGDPLARPKPLRTFHERAEVKPDARGNLVAADGTIVARAGKEARLYQDAHTARAEANRAAETARQLATNIRKAIDIGQSLERELTEYKAREKTVREMGITPEEQMQAFSFITQAKTDPLTALKGVLALAVSRGVDLSKLGVAGGGIDAASLSAALTGQIDTKLKPLLDNMQNRQRQDDEARIQQKEATDLENNTRAFFDANPAAKQYHNVFVEIYNDPRNQHMTLEHVWDKIRLNLAMRARQQNNNPDPERGQTRRRLPNGRSTFRSAPVEDDDTINGMAPVSQSYEEIARNVAKLV